jgi:phosphatidylglycerophosphatase GEP4
MVQSFNIRGIQGLFLCFSNPKLLLPSQQVKNITQINYKSLSSKYKSIIFDKDNTLTKPYNLKLHNGFIKTWSEIKSEFKPENILIVSNSVGTKDDKNKSYKELEKELGVCVLRSNEKKPFGIELALYKLNANPKETIVVGDRVLTDIVYGNRAGCYTILCTDVITEDGDNWIATRLRRLEKQFLKWYLNKI